MKNSFFSILMLMLSCRPDLDGDFAVLTNAPADEQTSNDDFIVQGLRFIPIDAGSFQMGSPESENGRQPHPESDSNVEIPEQTYLAMLTQNYYLSETEVTRELFQQYFDDDEGFINCLEDDCPAQFLSWHMAAGFTVFLSDLEDVEACYSCEGTDRDISCTSLFAGESIYACKGFRLPTETEWEFAARSGSDSAIWTPSGGAEIPTGMEFSCDVDQILSDGTPIADFAWYCSSTEHAHPVAELEPNGFGLYDMSGNVWEWAHDGYWIYPQEATANPVGIASDKHTLRGGRWGNEPYALRAAKRISLEPDFWDGNYGFRLAIRGQGGFQ